MRRATATVLLAGVLGGLSAAGPARAGLEYGDGAFNLDGNLRTASIVTRNYDEPLLFGPDNKMDALNLMLLRAVAGGDIGRVTWEAHAVQQLFSSTVATAGNGPGGLFGSVAIDTPYRLWQGAWNFGDDDNVQARLFVDRLNARLTVGLADITIGRQAITFGKAYFWNPLDVFLPFGSTQFDRDYKAGADAVRVDLALGDFSGLNLVGSAGALDRDDPYYQSAMLARFFTTVGDFDASVQGGKIRGGYQLGGGLTGEVATLQVRGEAAWFAAMPEDTLDSHLMAVAGIGHYFESTLDLQAEFLYNGGASGDLLVDFAQVSAGRLLLANEMVAGIVASYQLHPLIYGSLATLYGVADNSALIQPGITWSIANEADLIAGAAIAVGERPDASDPLSLNVPTEFGSYPHFGYVMARLFF